MARRLKGQTFLVCTHSGVTAIAALEVILDQEDLRGRGGIMDSLDKFSNSPGDRLFFERGLAHIGKPIFTFADPERVKHHPLFTGSTLILEKLAAYIREEGGEVDRSPFRVPFANALEERHKGFYEMENELHFRTTRAQFRETFGITLAGLHHWWKNRDQQREPATAHTTVEKIMRNEG